MWWQVDALPASTHPLLVYALLNLCLMSVEIGYGLLAGSLGLVCDGVHLAINCVGVALSLFALATAKQPPSLEAPFGFERVHVLAAFANAVFLVFVSLFLVVEAVAQFWEQPHYELHSQHHEDHVVTIAFAGFVVSAHGFCS